MFYDEDTRRMVRKSATEANQMSNPVMDRIDNDIMNRYGSSTVAVAHADRLNMEAVVNKTIGLFALLVLVAAATWRLTDFNPGLGSTLAAGGIVITLVLALVITFKKTISPPLIVAYAALEGVVLGAISNVFEASYPGIVTSAVVATLAVFVAMFGAWKIGLIRVTSRSRRIFTMLLAGYFLFAMANFVVGLFGANEGAGIFGFTSAAGYIVSFFAIALASYSLAVDFDTIDDAVNAGVSREYSWYLAFGLIVTLVWLYIEILRLIARTRR